jgi:hypothetical protein
MGNEAYQLKHLSPEKRAIRERYIFDTAAHFGLLRRSVCCGKVNGRIQMIYRGMGGGVLATAKDDGAPLEYRELSETTLKSYRENDQERIDKMNYEVKFSSKNYKDGPRFATLKGAIGHLTRLGYTHKDTQDPCTYSKMASGGGYLMAEIVYHGPR